MLSVAGLGIEPKFSLSESDVLPLDDPAILFLKADPDKQRRLCPKKVPYLLLKMKRSEMGIFLFGVI